MCKKCVGYKKSQKLASGLGRGVRVKHPNCIEEGLNKAYPNPEEKARVDFISHYRRYIIEISVFILNALYSIR